MADPWSTKKSVGEAAKVTAGVTAPYVIFVPSTGTELTVQVPDWVTGILALVTLVWKVPVPALAVTVPLTACVAGKLFTAT